VSREYQPGDKGAGRRHFTTEQDLAEHTTCPVGEIGQTRLIEGEPGQPGMVFMPSDGTTCAGPDCPKWSAIIRARDPKTNEPTRSEVCCTLHGRTNAMGIISRSKAPGGARG
jgi:hypothetical protein